MNAPVHGLQVFDIFNRKIRAFELGRIRSGPIALVYLAIKRWLHCVPLELRQFVARKIERRINRVLPSHDFVIVSSRFIKRRSDCELSGRAEKQFHCRLLVPSVAIALEEAGKSNKPDAKEKPKDK